MTPFYVKTRDSIQSLLQRHPRARAYEHPRHPWTIEQVPSSVTVSGQVIPNPRKQAADKTKITKDELEKWKVEVLKVQVSMKEINTSIVETGKVFGVALKDGASDFQKEVDRIAQRLMAFDTRPIIDKLAKLNQLLSTMAKTNPVIVVQVPFRKKLKELLQSTTDESDT